MLETEKTGREFYWFIFTVAGVLVFWSAYVFVLFQMMSFPDINFGALWLELIQQKEAAYVMAVSVVSVYGLRFTLVAMRLKQQLKRLSS
jgi:hypothetical protein